MDHDHKTNVATDASQPVKPDTNYYLTPPVRYKTTYISCIMPYDTGIK